MFKKTKGKTNNHSQCQNQQLSSFLLQADSLILGIMQVSPLTTNACKSNVS